MICKGQERCLYVFPIVEFERFTENVRSTPVTNGRIRDYSRMLFASASVEKTDAQGRVTVPPLLREYAGLAKDCTVIGANNRVEIWDSAAWDAYVAAKESDFAEITEELMPGVL